MSADDLARGERNAARLLQQAVQAHQNARLHDDRGLLHLAHIPIFQRTDEVGLHIGVGLTFFLGLNVAQEPNLIGHGIQHDAHAVLRGSVGLFRAGQLFVNALGVIIHVI